MISFPNLYINIVKSGSHVKKIFEKLFTNELRGGILISRYEIDNHSQ